MIAKNKTDFISQFDEVVDFRVDGKILYPLSEVLFLCLVGVLCGAESWAKLELFGKYKLNFLRKYFPYANGIPSKFTISRLIGLMDKEHFESWLNSWTKDLLCTLKNELIAIDGKSLNGKQKFSDKYKSAHLVNMFATESGLVLTQRSVPDKTNELTAIKDLIDNFDIKGATLSIDAIGCQKEIIKKIRDKDGDYFLAVKQNQKNLYEDISTHIDYLVEKKADKISNYNTLDKGHGRIEERESHCTSDVSELDSSLHWDSLKTIGVIKSTRHIKDKIETSKRYYISSKDINAEEFLKYSRQHWAIENNLHWVLDVTFSEDRCLIRQKNAAENMAVFRKLVLNIAKLFKTKCDNKKSVPMLRFGASLSDEALHEILSNWVTN